MYAVRKRCRHTGKWIDQEYYSTTELGLNTAVALCHKILAAEGCAVRVEDTRTGEVIFELGA